MHPSSIENMKRVRERYLGYLGEVKTPRAADVGGIGKSYSSLFEDLTDLQWTVCNIQEHKLVDVVMPGPYTIPVEDETFDLVVSGQMLEHCANPFKSVAEMTRVLKTGARLVLIAPSAGPYHAPPDAWRFLEDAFKFISEDVGNLRTVADWIDRDAPDERSRKWQDHIFVGEKLSG